MGVKKYFLHLIGWLFLIIAFYSSWVIYYQYIDYTNANQTKKEIKNLIYQGNVLHNLQIERGLSSLYLNEKTQINFDKLQKHRIKVNNLKHNFNYELKEYRKKMDTKTISSLEHIIYFTKKFNNKIINKIRKTNKRNKEVESLIFFIIQKELMGVNRALILAKPTKEVKNHLNHNHLKQDFYFDLFKEHSSKENLIFFHRIVKKDSKKKISTKINNILENIKDKKGNKHYLELLTNYINELHKYENILEEKIIKSQKESNNNKIFLLLSVGAISIIMIILSLLYSRYIISHFENMLNPILNNNVIYTETDLKGKITAVSNRFAEISNFKKEELMGRQHNIVRHPDVAKETFKDMWETIKNNKEWSGEIKNLKKGGGYYWVKATVSPLYDDNNTKIGYCSVRQDITNEKEQLQALQNQAKLSAMGEMIGMIAHQWRQPLTTINAIMSKLDLKKSMGNMTDEVWETNIKKHKELVNYMDETINDFLSFFQKREKKEVLCLSAVIRKPYKLVEALYIKHQIKFQIDTNNNKEYEIDIGKLEQVLMNLYKNSADEMIKRNQTDGIIKVSANIEDKILTIKVKDNAGGVPEDIIEDIFNPYFSTKEKNGTGLGLYMSKIIIENQLKGKLTVENENEGAVFNISFPI
jgi:PAS domain S-box-containing protein